MHCSSEKGDAGHSERNSSQDALQEQASTGSTANKEPNGGSLALLLNGPGRFSFDAGMAPELIASLNPNSSASEAEQPGRFGQLTPAPIPFP